MEDSLSSMHKYICEFIIQNDYINTCSNIIKNRLFEESAIEFYPSSRLLVPHIIENIKADLIISSYTNIADKVLINDITDFINNWINESYGDYLPYRFNIINDFFKSKNAKEYTSDISKDLIINIITSNYSHHKINSIMNDDYYESDYESEDSFG